MKKKGSKNERSTNIIITTIDASNNGEDIYKSKPISYSVSKNNDKSEEIGCMVVKCSGRQEQ